MGERRSRNGSGAGRGQAHAEGSYLAPIARIVPARGGGHGGVGCRHSCLGAATSGAHYSRKAFPRCFFNGMLLSGNNRIVIFPGPVRLSHFRRRPEPLANSASSFANPCAPAPQERLRTLSANGTALAHYSRKAKKNDGKKIEKNFLAMIKSGYSKNGPSSRWNCLSRFRPLRHIIITPPPL